MRNAFLSLVMLTSLVFVFSSQVQAHEGSTSGVTRVRGNVYDQGNGGSGIGGLTVTVTCNGHTKTDVTDSFGLYVVDFTHQECPKFDPVTSKVTFNGQPQQETVQVSDVYTATLDFYFGATNVPEFGMITGAVAAIGSGIAYLSMRKKFI